MYLPYLVAFCASLIPTRAISKFPKLLVVAFDGFRWDFINEHKTPKLYQIAKQGAWARNGVKNGFITKTTALFYSMSTGLHQESTGILGNTMYDPRYGGGRDSIYDYWGFRIINKDYIKKRSRKSFWYSGVPIWQVNDGADPGRKSGCMGWPLSDAYVNNKTCYKYRPWKSGSTEYKDWAKEVDELLSWFQSDNDPINLGLLYIDEPDTTEHRYNIYGKDVQKVLNELDKVAQYLVDKTKDMEINIIFTSDHGHTSINKKYDIIDLDAHIDSDWYIKSDAGYHPKISNGINASTLYDAFHKLQQKEPKFYLYCKSKAEIPSCAQEIPEKFHYKDNPRTGPIVVSPYIGYFIKKSWFEMFFKHDVFGSHGYSPEYQEMWPLLFGIGPQFRESYEFWNITYQIDLFELMCRILSISPTPNNGSLDRIGHMLKDSVNPSPSNAPQATSTNFGSSSAPKHQHGSHISFITKLKYYYKIIFNAVLRY